MQNEPIESMEDVIIADGRYPPEAYAFLHEGLNRAVRKEYGRDIGHGHHQHVTGAQICYALRDLAIERWGMLAETVLSDWGINETIDFGNMVYLLIEHGFMKKTDQDDIEDFRDVYCFEEAFGAKNRFELKDT